MKMILNKERKYINVTIITKSLVYNLLEKIKAVKEVKTKYLLTTRLIHLCRIKKIILRIDNLKFEIILKHL